MIYHLSSGLVVLSWFIPASLQQKNPVRDFCRRFGHQTAVIDSKLYIDGGLVDWNPISTYPQNYSNTWLLYQDLQQNGGSGMPQLYANLSKNGSVPNVSGGSLWGDDVNKRLYLFGGEYYNAPPSTFNLYSYDIINDYWDNFGPPSQSGISPVSFGAGVAISEMGAGYYYGGWLSNNSIPGWTGPPSATTGLIQYDMDQNSWTNSSGPDSTRRAEGTMNYIPASDGGMLVYFGGIKDLYGNGTVVGQEMNEIFLYDILSGRWYLQKTTGTIPQMRRGFCSGVTWPDDQSSYNIYLYGGAGMPTDDTAGYDDVYILTIPTFEWIKALPIDGNITGQYPHHSMSCNVVNNRSQMLIIGGTFPLTQDCDVSPQWGTHNLVLGQQSDPRASPWELFSPNFTTYAVPDIILSVVGGEATGGATKTAPSGGFDNPDLDVLMTRKASVAARTPTRAIPGATGSSSKTSSTTLTTGAMAGIAVGGTVVVAALLAGLCLFIRRHRGRYVASGGRPSKSSAGGSSGHHRHHPDPYFAGSGSLPWSPRTNSSGPGGLGPHSPGSYYASPRSPFTRRPSNLNVQQGPAELPATLDGGEYEMSQVSEGGGIDGMVPRPLRLSSRSLGGHGDGERMMAFDQPKFDDQGRAWYPQVSIVDGMIPSPTLHMPYSGCSPVTPGSTPQEMSTERHMSTAGWSDGGTGTSRATSMRRDTSGSGTERRHDTFYHA